MQGTIHTIKTTASTQHEARRLIAEGRAQSGDTVVADRQTAGQGRFGRSWISPVGGLYATVIVPSDPMLSLKAGLALVWALRAVSIPAGLKWPNDVLVEDRKMAGVLVETSGDLSLVGIGLNLTSSPLACSTCVSQYVKAVNRDEWVRGIVGKLIEMSNTPLDLDAYRRSCLTLGQHVRLARVGHEADIEGVATDVDDDGRLIILTQVGEVAVSSGECQHVRASTEDN